MSLFTNASDPDSRRLRQIVARIPELANAEAEALANAEAVAMAARLEPANLRYEAAWAEWKAACFALSQCLPHNADSRARSQDRVNAAAYQLAEAEGYRSDAAHKERQATISALLKLATNIASQMNGHVATAAARLEILAEILGVMRNGGFVDAATVEKVSAVATAATATAKATAALANG